mmetsp:Transcript_54498/g.129932  ORF Transcript_54498/g.129932 Transcript_54498/m.129932 type:complete len:229 (-) Transcript_54498:41-727(-)
MWCKPCDLRATYLHLKVVTFDRCKDFPQRLVSDHAKLELLIQSRCFRNRICRNISKVIRRQCCEQSHSTHCIVKISDCILKVGVSLPHEVMQGVLGLVLLHAGGQTLLSSAYQPLELLQEGLQLEELLQKRLVRQEGYVLLVIIGLVLPMSLLLGISRVYALENAKPSEVCQRNLQLHQSLGTGDVGSSCAFLTFNLAMNLILASLLLVSLALRLRGLALHHLCRGLP